MTVQKRKRPAPWKMLPYGLEKTEQHVVKPERVREERGITFITSDSERKRLRRQIKKVARQNAKDHIRNEEFDMFSEKFNFIYGCSRFNFYCENTMMQLLCKRA